MCVLIISYTIVAEQAHVPEQYTEHSSSSMPPSTACWLELPGFAFGPAMAKSKPAEQISGYARCCSDHAWRAYLCVNIVQEEAMNWHRTDVSNEK